VAVRSPARSTTWRSSSRHAAVQGSPADAILADAEADDADPIATGRTGRSGLDRLLLGSTTERPIRDADVPIIAVDAGRRDADAE
jgi:nucleotide-binding universal stress UspA family protein